MHLQDWVKNADLMWKQSVWSSGIAASLGARHLADGGLLVLPGAQVHLLHTLQETTIKSLPSPV